MGDSMQLTLGKAWNQVNANGLNGPHRDTWTLEGLPVDTLMVYSVSTTAKSFILNEHRKMIRKILFSNQR
jgi:hypothetical protein